MEQPPHPNQSSGGDVSAPRSVTIGVGLACGAVGASFLYLAGVVVYALVTRPGPAQGAIPVLLVLLAIGFPFAYLAVQMLFPRRRDDPAAITPTTWYIVGGVFALGSLALFVFVVINSAWFALPVTAFPLLLARWAYSAARERERMRAAAQERLNH
ncbi:MAG: hypothetical protein AAF430_12335 [Myxococcota bacterium]